MLKKNSILLIIGAISVLTVLTGCTQQKTPAYVKNTGNLTSGNQTASNQTRSSNQTSGNQTGNQTGGNQTRGVQGNTSGNASGGRSGNSSGNPSQNNTQPGNSSNSSGNSSGNKTRKRLGVSTVPEISPHDNDWWTMEKSFYKLRPHTNY